MRLLLYLAELYMGAMWKHDADRVWYEDHAEGWSSRKLRFRH